MNLIDKIGTYHFVAEPFHTDFTDHLTLSVLGNHLLNCAGFHASERGLDMASVNEENYTWVLSRLAVEMREMPKGFEEYSIETWVESVYRLFTYRNYAVLDKDGNALGYARSIWALIDRNTRHPTDLMDVNGGSIADFICDHPCPIDPPSRIKVRATQPEATLTAKYSDIDINGHVNSIRYIEHILDLFPLEFFSQKRISRFEMAYVAESHYGDTLDLVREKQGEDCYALEIKKGGEETVCRAKVAFEENPIQL